MRSAVSKLSLAAVLLTATACAHSTSSMSTTPPSPDPRVGLRAGTWDAGEAVWNLKVVSQNRPSPQFLGHTNSDLSFTGSYAIQGSYNGYQVWDISNPAKVTLKTAYVCPASQSDVSVYKNLLFVSGEGLSARLDCGAEGVKDTVSTERLRGLRIFDITDIEHPKNVGNVQTCRGSHTHSVLADPKDPDNVYVYISGSSVVRSSSELAGCANDLPANDPNSALFRIEVIKVPVAHPEQAAIVSSPRIFNDLTAPARHGETSADSAASAKEVADARAAGGFVVTMHGEDRVLPPQWANPLLDSVAKANHGDSIPNAADSTALREALPDMVKAMMGTPVPGSENLGPTQCHDITVYPAIGLGGGACEGYGLLLDISDPAHPTRIGAVADSNFSYWHSATFNNAGTKILFSDEWGGGGQPKCRVTDKKEWGADAIFTIADRKMQFQSYYKLPAPQTPEENCVAHNGSLIPIPGRDIMVQSWYQGGISVFDWTDAAHPKEIAFFDRGPMDSTQMVGAGSWSAYWYNGIIVSSEIARGLDVFELVPSGFISKNEIEAAKTVHLDHLNVQGQPKFVWPATVSLARAYLDQLERAKGLGEADIASARQSLDRADKASATERRIALTELAAKLDSEGKAGVAGAKVKQLAGVVRQLAETSSLAGR